MTEAFEKVIIGIDPGTNIMGYAVVSILNKKPQVQAMGVLRLDKFESHYLRLRRIFDKTIALVEQYKPDEMALEAPFFGKNVQSMLKLGRAQGVAMVAALERDVPISEYEPRKVKMAITGNGSASKEQVREMLRRTLNINSEALEGLELDATDALAVAMCHYYEASRPIKTAGPKNWKDFIAKNPDRVAPAVNSKK